ncbi:MAG: RNA-binding protein [Sphingomonadales bacterium]
MPGRSATGRSGERRCIVTGTVDDRARMVRFVVAPDGSVVPDISAKLPGRGLWITASRAMVDRAVERKLFARHSRGSGGPPPSAEADLADLVAKLLDRSCLRLLGLARRSGKVLMGFEKVRALAANRRAAALILASDAAPATKKRLHRLGNQTPVMELWTRLDLGLALGRENVVHAAVIPCRLATRFLVEVDRRSGFGPGCQSGSGQV